VEKQTEGKRSYKEREREKRVKNTETKTYTQRHIDRNMDISRE
jgi:hypothetical protein